MLLFVYLSLQLRLEFIEKMPVRTLGDNLIWAAFDHSGITEAQSVETHRIRRIIFAPFVVRNHLHGIKSIVVILGEASVYQKSRRPLRLTGAEVRGLQ